MDEAGIYTCVRGNNAGLIEQVCSLYLTEHATIADITYGKGAFWSAVPELLDRVAKSDKYSRDEDVTQHDFTKLPYPNEMFDVCVFDPPYVHTPGAKFQKNGRYKNSETHLAEKTRGGVEKYHKAVTQRYRRGMSEACRVTRIGGRVWVKCQDEVCSGYQWWTHIEVYEIARRLGMFAKDLFVLLPDQNPVIQHKQQKHARKNHSYLWIFERPTVAKQRQIAKLGIP